MGGCLCENFDIGVDRAARDRPCYRYPCFHPARTRSNFLETPPDQPDQTSPPDAPEQRPPDRFPAIVLAGPGCLCLLFVLFMTPQPGAGLLFGLVAAIGASFFFGVIAARARTENAKSIGILLAFSGPVLWCLILMGSL